MGDNAPYKFALSVKRITKHSNGGERQIQNERTTRTPKQSPSKHLYWLVTASL